MDCNRILRIAASFLTAPMVKLLLWTAHQELLLVQHHWYVCTRIWPNADRELEQYEMIPPAPVRMSDLNTKILTNTRLGYPALPLDDLGCPPGTRGLRPHPHDVHKYLRCGIGVKPQVEQCPRGHIFDGSSSVCVYSDSPRTSCKCHFISYPYCLASLDSSAFSFRVIFSYYAVHALLACLVDRL